MEPTLVFSMFHNIYILLFKKFNNNSGY